MASLDEIDNCGLFLEQRRRHIFCSGKLSSRMLKKISGKASCLSPTI